MNTMQMSHSGYGATNAHIRTPRSIEYDVLARATARIKAACEEGVHFARLAEALTENNRIWTLFATDVAEANNGLPAMLRAQLFYLAEFTFLHTQKVLKGEATADALIEINTAVLRGLAGQGAAA
jgi:flagellar biosynthesis activator protein FlaF